MKDVLFAFRCGFIGLMIFLFINTATNMMQSLGSENFTVWMGSKVHDQIWKRGDKAGERDFTRHLYEPDDLNTLEAIQEEDEENPETFVDQIRDAQSPFAKFIQDNLTEATRKAVSSHKKGSEPSDDLKKEIVATLNALIQTDSLYEKDRLAGVAWDEETQRMLVLRGFATNADIETEFTKDDLVEDDFSKDINPVDLNRMILTDAFPAQLAIIPHGSELWPNVSPHIKLPYYIGPGMKYGFFLGALIGAIIIACQRKWGKDPSEAAGEEESQTLILPLWMAPALALSGIFVHGYFLGLVAFLIAGYSKGKDWMIICVRTLSFGVVLFWGMGTELWWSEGWSKVYPGLNRFLKGFFEG